MTTTKLTLQIAVAIGRTVLNGTKHPFCTL